MPKLKTLIPPSQQLIEDDLRARYGGMMTAIQVGRELGVKHHSAYEAWLADVPHTLVNGHKRWRVSRIAEKIYRCESL